VPTRESNYAGFEKSVWNSRWACSSGHYYYSRYTRIRRQFEVDGIWVALEQLAEATQIFCCYNTRIGWNLKVIYPHVEYKFPHPATCLTTRSMSTSFIYIYEDFFSASSPCFDEVVMLLRQILRTPIFLYHSICSIPSPKPYFLALSTSLVICFYWALGCPERGQWRREKCLFFFLSLWRILVLGLLIIWPSSQSYSTSFDPDATDWSRTVI